MKCILDNFPVQRVHFHLTLTSCVHSALLFASKSVCFHLGDGNTCLRNHSISNVSTCWCDISCERVWYRFLRNPTDSVCSLKCAQFWHNCDLHGFGSTKIANLTTLNRFIDRTMYKRNQSEFQNSFGNNVLKHGIRFYSYLPPTGAS